MCPPGVRASRELGDNFHTVCCDCIISICVFEPKCVVTLKPKKTKTQNPKL